ncbi:MAG TPA: zinc-dependent peptidase [Chryseosolibacter sp.]|nr:zinc-dependent peptidase [Chryseosolibacter sp.]
MLISSVLDKRWTRKLYFNHISPAFRGSQVVAYVSPYSKLKSKELKEFEWRAHYFFTTTEIQFREFENEKAIPFNRVRYLIASVAAQMTFRLPDDCFSIYHRIIIYPDYYYSRVNKTYHKGETNPSAGIMVFSLRGIVEGFDLPYDGVNLLYHEMAHALYLEHKGMPYNLFDEEIFDQFHRYANDILSQEQPGDFFLRPYALTNVSEFFAVATENFFERSTELNQALPDLYRILKDLYRQDPLLLK